MTNIITALCQECKKQFEYDLKPGYPRKYCVECSEIKKAQYANKTQPEVPVVKDEKNPSDPSSMPQIAKHDIVITRTEKPHSYEFGPANQRHKIYYAEVIELRDHIQQLEANDLTFKEAFE